MSFKIGDTVSGKISKKGFIYLISENHNIKGRFYAKTMPEKNLFAFSLVRRRSLKKPFPIILLS